MRRLVLAVLAPSVLACAGVGARAEVGAAPTAATASAADVAALAPLGFEIELPPLGADDDVAVVAEISAAEVRFDVVPRADVTFQTTRGGQTQYTAIRHNLPEPVIPGVTYRDVRVRVVIASSLPSAERVLHALDQVPLPRPVIAPALEPERAGDPP